MDGGSTDGTADVLRRYSPWIDYWESSPDTGQANAINKGFRRATGEIFQWINSDDLLEKEALRIVGAHADGDGLIAGHVRNFGDGVEGATVANFNLDPAVMIHSFEEFGFHQPGLFFSRKVLARLSANEPVPERYNYIFDWYLVICYLGLAPATLYVPNTLALFRLHQNSKTVSQQDSFVQEHRHVYRDLAQSAPEGPAAAAARLRVRMSDWYNRLDRLSLQKVSKRDLATLVLKDIVPHPERWDRFTFGWVRKNLS